jgi:pilus assembly protein FimV
VAVNRTKVLEAAQKFLSKGQYDKAVVEYQKLVHEDPRDVRTLLKIGDLHTRRSKPKDAIDVYQRVADLYAKQGFFLKAVAVYKQILKLDPAHLESTLKLAKMYEELALTSDALSTYELVADAYMAQANVPKALETMQRMVELDGNNVAVRIKHAEALSKANKPVEAAQAFAAGALLLKEQGRMDDYLRVVERQLYHDPENVSIARELSGLYLERSDPKRALAKLQICFKADPRDVQTLEMLAEAFRLLGQSAKTISVLKEIARLHGEAGADEPRRRTLKRVLELDPADAEAKQALSVPASAAKPMEPARPTAAPPRRPAPLAPPPPPVAVRGAPPARPAEPEEIDLEEAAEELDLLEDSDGESDDVLIVDEPSQPELSVRASVAPALEDPVLALLAEADAREGAGDYEGAVSALQGVLELEPDHMAAHERLKDIYLAADRRVDAVKELLWLSSAWEPQGRDRAVHFAEAAFELAPKSEATRRRLTALGIALPGEAPKARARSATSRDDSVDIELDAMLPPLEPMARDHAAPARPVPTREVSADLLDLPISPDDFDAAPPARRAPNVSPEVASEWLERELSAAEFDAPSSRSSDAATPVGDQRVRPSRPAQVVHDNQPSREFAAIGTSELSISDAPGAAGLDSAPPSEAFESAPPLESSRATPLPGADTPSDPGPLVLVQRRPGAPSPEAPVLRGRDDEPFEGTPPTATHEYTLDDPHYDQSPDPTVPGGQIPEQIERSAQVDARATNPRVLEVKDSEPAPELEAAAPSELPRARESEPAFFAESEPPVPVASEPAQATSTPAPVRESAPVSGAREVVDSHAPREALPVEIEEVLDEADFFASQGMLDEALDLIQESILIYPKSADLKARLAEYEARAEQKEAEDERASELAEDDSFDIAEQLANELVEVDQPSESDEMIDVESVFAQFKKGVAEQIAPDDSETHFDLGIAYKEMGLIDDAINEFEVAAKSRHRACTALTMVGMCHLERGNADLAITYFERALTAEGRTPPEELALNYEIATVYEKVGQLDRALAAFELVAARDRSYRGVSARLDQLKKRGVKSVRAR